MSVDFPQTMGGKAAASVYGGFADKDAKAKQYRKAGSAVGQGAPALEDYIASKKNQERAGVGQHDKERYLGGEKSEDLPPKESLVLPKRGTVR
ncbi:MAG: hypothetical protein WC901_05430 [Candidatus Margulisiibacteriota bacterium]